MKSLFTILNESYQTFQVDVLLKNYKSNNKSEIVNKIRAVPYVIRVKLIDDPRLHDISKTHDYELSLLRVKFLNMYDKPSKAINIIKTITEKGKPDFHQVKGVIFFKPLLKTLRRTKY